MSLLSAIPGLSAHEVAIPPVVQPATIVVSFDTEAALNVIRAAISEVALAFPAPDPWGWLTQNRPDVIAELRKSRNEMGEACHLEDIELLKAKSIRFTRLHLRAWELYKLRPPVIEIQEERL